MKMSNPNVQAMADLINAEKKADKVIQDAQDTATKAVTDKAVKDLGGTVVTDIVDKQTILNGAKPEAAKPSAILKDIAADQKAEAARMDKLVANENSNANKLNSIE